MVEQPVAAMTALTGCFGWRSLRGRPVGQSSRPLEENNALRHGVWTRAAPSGFVISQRYLQVSACMFGDSLLT